MKRTNPAPEKIGERITPSSPAATGAAGPAFEAKVGAACLTLLLTRGAPPFLGAGTLQTVHLQAGHLGRGWFTDDILLEATSLAGEPVKAALQVKRAFVLAVSDEDCLKALRGALADFRNSAQFNQQRDIVGLVTSSLTAKLARGLRTLLDCARAAVSAADMVHRLAIPAYLSQPTRDYYNTIKAIFVGAHGGTPTDDELWRFLARFHVIDLDLNVPGGIAETMMRSLLAATSLGRDPNLASATWNELITLALNDAGRAMSYTRERLPAHLLQQHGTPTGYLDGVSRLLEDTKIVIESIRTAIGGQVAIPRNELLGELCRCVEESPLTFVIGEAGSGKSALVKLAFAIATQGGTGFAFRAASLAGTHINDVLHRFALTLDGLREQTALHERKVLWVDSLERLMERPAEQRAAFVDLLRALKLDSNWHLIITCRDYSAETVRTAFFHEAGLVAADIQVGNLSETELDGIAATIPSLQRILAIQPLRRLLKNPFFLDKAAQMNWAATEPLPTSERTFRSKVWKEIIQRIDEDADSGLPQLREQVMVEIALRRARALEPFVSASGLDTRALHRLVRDSLFQTPLQGSGLYAPAHDVFEDWALMRWMDDEFIKQGRQLVNLLGALGTYPALRRAFRKWLTESLDADKQATDSLVLDLIQSAVVAAHWREDTLVGVLQSAGANGFLQRNTSLLLADGARLLRQIIHILRVACRAAIPRRLFSSDGKGEFFLPRGNGWVGAAKLMEAAMPSFTEADFMLVIGFLEDWILLTKWGLRYPEGTRCIAKIAWHWLPRIPWRSPVADGKERLFKVILTVPLAAEPELTTMVTGALDEELEGQDNDTVLELIFNHFACDAIVRDMPDLAFQVAEHVLSLDRSLEEVINDRSGFGSDEVNGVFGLGSRFLMDDFPSCAYHGPYLRMLWHHPSRGLDFILQFINRACDAFAHPNNRYEHFQPPSTIEIRLLDGTLHQQYGNGRLWEAYRGMTVVPDCLASALMALENWLLEKAKRDDPDLEAVLVDLLRRSNNVAVSAVVASIATAYPGRAGEAAFSLLTCRHLLRADLERSAQEPFSAAQTGALELPAIDAEKALYDSERKESANLPHRSQNLEYVAIILQMLDKFRERVWALIDAYRAALPSEGEQDRETMLFRIQLHRIDTRRFVETGRTDDGHIMLGTTEPEPDIQQFLGSEQPHSEACGTAMALLAWGMSAFKGDVAIDEEWRKRLTAAQSLLDSGYGSSTNESAPAKGGIAYVAAVCIRDHWVEMTPEQQDWCARITCNAIETDADSTNTYAIVGQNPMDGSRPAAFILTALFDKSLPATTQARLLPTLALAIIHSVEEVVLYAVQGVGRYLWRIDRPLALTCIQALVTQAIDKDIFIEQQTQKPFTEREADAAMLVALRMKLRAFINRREAGSETPIASLDLTQWPGRAIARHIFSIVAQHPHDPFTRQLLHRCVTALPLMWKADQQDPNLRRRNRNGIRRHDSRIAHLLMDAVCRFVLELAPKEAVEYLTPVVATTSQHPEQVAQIVTWLILHQGENAPANTLWALWQCFADNFASNASAENIDAEYSSVAKLLRELFLGPNWKEQRDWLPLHGEANRLRALFGRLPATRRCFEFYAYYLAHVGTPTLPDALIEVAAKLVEAQGRTMLNEIATFYLEEILTRLICGGNVRIRTERELRNAILTILDSLVAAGSSPAYKLRDDFLTPSA